MTTDFAAERADFARVLAAMRAIQAAPLDALRSPDWLADRIREAGLVPIPEAATTYAGEEDFINGTQQGLIQLPREFARWLLLLGEQKPASYLEIGCFNGATISLAAAVLRRFVPDARVATCDVFPAFIFHEEANALTPIEYRVGRTSYDFRGEKFEAVFIDGDHSFEWAWADYVNVGRAARLCALHDVHNAPYRELHLGGVCGAWERMKAEEGGELIEIFEHPTAEIMGIGVRVRR
ncbi:MAG: class I SAM-dependent methyltransferase [Chthoniobacteraceae bacterium]